MDIVADDAAAVKPPVKRQRIASLYEATDVHVVPGLRWDARYPKPTRASCLPFARRLWREATGKAWAGSWKAAVGNLRSYPRGSVFYVNPRGGWSEVLHELSHVAFDSLKYPTSRRRFSERKLSEYAGCLETGRHHTAAHAAMERDMKAVAVIWLDKLAAKPATPKPVKPPIRERNHARVLARIATWEEKLTQAKATQQRAEKMLIELQRKNRRYTQ